MPVKLSTTVEKIGKIENVQNRFLVTQYLKIMDSTSASSCQIIKQTKQIIHHLGLVFYVYLIPLMENVLLEEIV
jgi:hypothetical protein